MVKKGPIVDSTIFYKAKSDLDLIGFTDSDWAGDNTDRNSTSGYVFMFLE